MASREIRVRLDEPASDALAVLEGDGADTARVVSEALISAATRVAQREELRAIARQVAADPVGRQEMAEIHTIMDEMHPTGGL